MSKITKRNSINEEAKQQLKVDAYDEQSYDSCLDRVLKGTATLKDLANIKDAVIDFAKCERKIKTIQLIYSAGSQVGACTVVAGNMYTAKLTDKTIEVFKKSLKMLKENSSHKPYESIWVEGINKFTFKFKDGAFYDYFVVTNEEIKELEKRITAMDYNSVTLEELQALQADLPPFVRAWQESSIDVSKDKDKVFVKQFEDFFKKIDTTSTYLKNAVDQIKSNFAELKTLHKAGRINDMHYKITLPTSDGVYDDMLGDINYAIAEAHEEYFNGGLLNMYKRSNRNYYKQYADACLPYPELALYIHQIYRLCGQANQEGTKITKDQYADLRNKIYTKAAAYNVNSAEVVKVAVSVAMRYIREITIDGKITIDLGTANVDNYKDSNVTKIFPAEYEVLRTNQPMIEELNIIWMDESIQITNGQEIEFENGISIDGDVELDEMFTGIAFNQDGKLVYEVDVYEYETSKSFITMATFAEEQPNRETDLGEFAAKFFEENDEIILTGGRGNVLIANDKQTFVAKTTPSKDLMAKGKAAKYCVTNILSFVPNAGKARIFLIEVQ
jgi:hypothetical protein